MIWNLCTMAACVAVFTNGVPGRPTSNAHAKPVHGPGATSDRATQIVGWHDEMNDLATWKPRDGGMPPEIFVAHPGAITLRLAHVPDGYPYSYQWGGVTRTATVDLGRYPILVARISSIKPGSYCHLDVEQLDYSGKPVKTKRTPTLEFPGLSTFDLGKEYGPHVWRVVMRINVGGKLEGAEAEISWVRFVRREDLSLLKELPDWQIVKLEP